MNTRPSSGGGVKVSNAIFRLHRQDLLTSAEAGAANARLNILFQAWREVQPVDAVRELAKMQLRLYELRAADALQLAAALVWCNQRPRQRAFLCRDQRLSKAARRAGFDVIHF